MFGEQVEVAFVQEVVDLRVQIVGESAEPGVTWCIQLG